MRQERLVAPLCASVFRGRRHFSKALTITTGCYGQNTRMRLFNLFADGRLRGRGAFELSDHCCIVYAEVYDNKLLSHNVSTLGGWPRMVDALI